MDYTNLGRTALKVSRICLGTMNFGPKTSDDDSFLIMDRALDLGINFFDTADVYGWKKGEGITEQIVGRWFAKGGGRRDKVVLATKVYGDMGDWPNESRLSALHIRKAVEGSLKRMQTDYIDLYQMHHIHRDAPWEEVWQAYEVLVQQGKVLYAGSSNFGGWHIAKANEQAKKRNFLGLVSEQSHYHLLNRNIEMEVIPACEDYGLGLIPWSPLASGLLAGRPKEGDTGRRSDARFDENYTKHAPQLDKWEALCKELGEAPADVAIAWHLHQKAVTAPIVGPRTMEQLEGGVHAVDIKLDAEVLAKIDAIFPGKKTSPEEHAW
jgi:aryl-alcohol dehydrogenase-like predicted oxidoreductase